MRKTLLFLLTFILGALRGRPVEIPRVSGRGSVHITPDGRYMPVMAGGDETSEEKAAREEKEEADRLAAEAEAEAEAKRKAEEEDDPPPEGEPFDEARARRTIERQRQSEKEEKERRQKAEQERDELRRAQETEHETAKREADEAKLENERLRETARRLRANEAIRDAAAEADIPAKKVSRLLKLIDRDEIAFDADGEPEAESVERAVDAVLDEFPEFKAEAPPAGDPPEENPGGAPDRRRKPKKIDRAEVERLAKEDPDELNRLIDENKIPASALGD